MSLNLTDADRAAWADYEARSRRAHEQYKALPISFHRIAVADACHGCGASTTAAGRVCRACRREERAS